MIAAHVRQLWRELALFRYTAAFAVIGALVLFMKWW